MNLTIASNPPVGITERRRFTYAGVTGLKLELADGTTFTIEEHGDTLIIRAALGHFLLLAPLDVDAVQVATQSQEDTNADADDSMQ